MGANGKVGVAEGFRDVPVDVASALARDADPTDSRGGARDVAMHAEQTVKSVAGLRSSPLTATMPDIATTRLILHPVDSAEAGRIRNRTPTAEDQWAADYPFDGDIVALGAFVAATERAGEQRPFGYYRITQRSDRHAIGGIGFKGPPENGVVEVGYGLAPSARGHDMRPRPCQR